jgi:hypothetical protein
MWKIFGSGRNVYVIEESSQIHSTPINLKSRFNKINTNSDITPPNNLDMVTFDFFCSHDILCLPRHNHIN